MTREAKYTRGNNVDGWTLTELLGVGGNGEAWSVASTDEHERVIKILRRSDPEALARFRREIETVRMLVPSGFPALPVEVSVIPHQPTRKMPAYYISPKATLMMDALAAQPVREKVAAVASIAAALADLLHTHGQHHRDIKPDNLYVFGGQPVVGDFGLVTNPATDTDSITAEGKVIGPWKFLPSEVFHPLGEVRWGPVDVHCLALTLWCLVTERPDPPRGLAVGSPSTLSRQLRVPPPPDYTADPYADDEPHDEAHRRTYIAELDDLLVAATNPDPVARPTMRQFAESLQWWDEGIDIRDRLVESAATAKVDETAVLNWLAAEDDSTLGIRFFDVSEPEAPSPIEGMPVWRFASALAGLVDNYEITGQPYPETGKPIMWSRVRLTNYGVDRSAHGQRIQADAHVLLRAMAGGGTPEAMHFSGNDEKVTVAGVTRTPSEMFLLLTYLSDSGLIEFTEQRASGNSAALYGFRLTRNGRETAAGR